MIRKNSSLAASINRAQRLLDRAQSTASEKRQAQQRLNEARQSCLDVELQVQQAKANFDQWSQSWDSLVSDIQLSSERSPETIDSALDKLNSIFDHLKDKAQLDLQQHAYVDSVVNFEQSVGGFVDQYAPQLSELNASDATTQLKLLLKENISHHANSQQIEQQIATINAELVDTAHHIESGENLLRSMCTQAQCEDPDQLEALEKRSRKFLEMTRDLNNVEKELLEEGEGASMEELESNASTVDADNLAHDIGELTQLIADDLAPKHMALTEQKGRQERELELTKGGTDAAMLAEDAQIQLAGIQRSAGKYVNLKVAAGLLRQQIEDYRQENQGPLLKLASGYFAKLTLGGFVELVTDFDGSDEPILAGLRSNDQRVSVEGMSSGTRDQLYLALRMAAIEMYIEQAEPMPFIVDDVLIEFDDARSAAALEALLMLAKKTQVLVFTHHLSVVQQAELMSETVQIHHL